MIQFVGNYDDLSSERGYQFRFCCDKCGNGYMSRFIPSKVGIAGTLLRTAGSLFGGWAGTAGYSSYDVQRLASGPEHDSALRSAVEEGKQYFHQCTRCGKWVCPEACWNGKANLCENCAPNFEEEMAANRAQVMADAARQQMYEKAQQTNYVGSVDMRVQGEYAAPSVAERRGSTPVCSKCNADVGAAKFCPQCGTPAGVAAKKFCTQCGTQAEPGTKFCGECGGKLAG
ncbi:MAG TPA: zinc ribbon domain-containing protein [Bryobacteraceae bacterium]|nr:zinc ribbon domain-containing protein [Bryobacteraceae bacterium]